MRRRRLTIALFLVLASCSSAAVINSPNAVYLANTRTATFSDPDEALLASISGGGLMIDFSSLLRASTVGNNCATWASPPDAEAATPRVLWSGLDDNFNPVPRVTFLLSSRVGGAVLNSNTVLGRMATSEPAGNGWWVVCSGGTATAVAVCSLK